MAIALQDLQDSLGAVGSAAIGDAVLTRLLARAVSDLSTLTSTSTFDSLVLTYALALCYRRLAAESAGNLDYTSADKSVDKTTESPNWQKLYDAAWASLPETVRELGAAQPDVGQFGADPSEVEL